VGPGVVSRRTTNVRASNYNYWRQTHSGWRVALLALGPLQERGRAGCLALDDLHQLPSLLTPLVQDLLELVRDQRYGRVFPFLHGSSPCGVDDKAVHDRAITYWTVSSQIDSKGRILVDGNRVLAGAVRWAVSRGDRRRGLLGSKRLRPGEALVIDRARGVHTFGMKFPIDVVFCDARWEVLHVNESLQPNRVTRFVRGCRYVVELPAGAANGLRTGQRLTAGAPAAFPRRYRSRSER
jgi:uncharacterized protein